MKNFPSRWARGYLVALGVAAALCLAAGLFYFALAGPAERSAPRYLLMDTGGRLGLYTADGTGPLAEYPVYTRLLPESDFLALQQGVPVADEAELARRLEDYGL